MSINDKIWQDLRTGTIDVNNQDQFFGALIKGLIYDIKRHLSIRGEQIDHFIINSGDDEMYLWVKGVDQSKEPLQQTNEDFVYNRIPRCIVTPAGINIQTDQLTSPYTNGLFQYQDEDSLFNFNATYRRLPIEMGVSLKYYFNSFTDTLSCCQQICSKLAFIKNFKIVYLGQTIHCTYNIPNSVNPEMNMQFDGLTTDSKYRSIGLDITVDTNLPIIQNRTITPADCIIDSKMSVNIDPDMRVSKNVKVL